MEFSVDELLSKQKEIGRKISRIAENFRKSTSQAKMTKGDVQSRIQRLEEYWALFQGNHDVLTFRHKDAIKTSEYVTKEYADFIEEAYMEQRGRLLDLANQFVESSSKSAKGSMTKVPGEQVVGSGTAPLPRIQLPEFHGEYVQWPAFKDLFLSIMERNKHLSQVDRLHYLKTCLHGQAADHVRDLPTTNDNYERAWSILQELYENKRILVRSCLDRLASLPKMKQSSSHELNNIHKGVIAVVNTLEGLGRPINRTEDWFVYSVVNLFDPITRDKWEERITESNEPPTFSILKDFMTKRRQQLEALGEESSMKVATGNQRSHSRKYEARPDQSHQSAKGTQRTVRANHAEQGPPKPVCCKCRKEHYLMQCADYKALSSTDRRGYVEKSRLCYNCLGNHQIAACPSTKSCMTCGEKHHSSLHDAFRDGPKQSTVHHSLDCRTERGKVLLATALIEVADRHGRYHKVRALIDQGSEISMMSEGLTQRLQLTRTSSAVDIFGVGGQQLAKARGRVTLTIKEGRSASTIKVMALVLPKLTNYTHGYIGLHHNWSHLEGLELADPSPSRAARIEVLLGADVYPAIMRSGVKKGAHNEPIAQLTVFGWIISGMAGSTTTSSRAQVHQVHVGDSLSSLVRKFWEQEEIQEAQQTLTAEELECENHFKTTHSRTPEGRYQVRLPFRQEGPITPGSRAASWHALKRMEQRFKRGETFKTLYHNFISDYEQLGHMTLVTEPASQDEAHYLPHHGVLKLSSTTTKLRVVFNGSWTEPGKKSLNDCLHVGPNLLPLLADVLLRWRKHLYVVTADVTKMYRQILVHPEDRDHQRILWRHNESEHVSEFRLNTVTYGLSCAPYLAVRAMRQLALDEGSRYPIGAAAIQQDSYVDDILTGADTIPALKEAATQVQQLCMAGGFPLQKWASNVSNLHDVIPLSCQNSPSQDSQQQDRQPEGKTWTDATHSTLGIQWSPRDDTFHFAITTTEGQTTKRGVVSKAAQLFDPLGWLTPVVVRAKITIQSTWLRGLGWDDPLPTALANEWMDFCSELPQLEKVTVQRPLFQKSSPDQVEYHGFCDASERAYGAVIYLRSRSTGEQWTTALINAKSKVAPLQQVSLPRLELCAAHLLARLVHNTINTLDLKGAAVHLWSDSTVALGWIQAHPSRWKTFVANRVADIQRRVPEAQWHHVAGVINPADCASRGLSPTQLINWTLWWKGPEFLQQDCNFANSGPVELENLPEERGPIVAVTTEAAQADATEEMLNRFSSHTRLLRVTAWCRRWLARCHHSATTTATNDEAARRAQPRPLTAAELIEAEGCWIRRVQRTAYKREIELLTSNQCIPSSSKLASLTPTLDNNNVLRVGGRLKKSMLDPDEAHQAILPADSQYTKLYVLHIHRSTLHGGVQVTLGTIRQRYWIPKGRNTVKGIIRKCITCLRWRAEPTQQLMGELPSHRVTPAQPFHSTGVDYAGPIWLRTAPGRGHKAYKGYLAVFVCMVTKAVHLEVASNYSTEAFLAAFRRFISRRGICTHIYSDCGTNFQGADAELRRLFNASSQENHSLRDQMANLRVEWHFNPPGAPHFGGLWEAAVKSTKHHLRRVIGETRLTFEEMTTLLAQVEACLNSRPLAALSDDPTDMAALTPGHFLIGSELNALPEPSLQDVNENRVTRWQLVTKMRDHFWTRWRKEYLHNLTMRPRWRRSMEDLAVGRLCIIINESSPPSQWPLARVTEVHPGTDGKVRVAKLVTATSEMLRPIQKLIALPIVASGQ